MKKLNELYEAPCIEVMQMQVEQCVLAGSYGDSTIKVSCTIFTVFGIGLKPISAKYLHVRSMPN